VEAEGAVSKPAEKKVSSFAAVSMRPSSPRRLVRSSCFPRAAALSAVAAAALSAAPLAAAGAGGAGAASIILLTESACFDRQQLGAEVDRYLDSPPDTAASVTVRDGADHLVIESASGAVEKDVSGWSCEQRLEFAAVSVSIILGGNYTPRGAGVEDAGPADTAPPVDAGLAAPAPPLPGVPQTPTLPAPRPPLVEIVAQGGAVFDLLPRPAAGFLLSANRTLIGPLDLHASLLVTSSVAVPFRTTYAEASLLAGLIEGCVAGGDALRLHFCAGLAAGRLGVVWPSLSPASTPSAWSAAAGRFDAHVAVSRRVGFAASVDVFLPLGQQRIDVVQPDLCPDQVPTAVVPVCNALTPFSRGKVVETRSLAGAGVMLSVGPVLTFW
jgi:hypothetical protein